MKKVLALVLSLVLVVGVVATLAACGGKDDAPQSDFEYVQEKGELVIGITYFAPMNYFDENNETNIFEVTSYDTAALKIKNTDFDIWKRFESYLNDENAYKIIVNNCYNIAKHSHNSKN